LSDEVTAAVTGVVASGDTAGAPDNTTLENMLAVTGGVASGDDSGTLSWMFDSGNEAFDYLADGESLELTYTITATDSQGEAATQAVTITITGTNDAPVIGSGDDSAGLTETNASLSAAGSLAVEDLDLSDSVTATVTGLTVGGTGPDSPLSEAALEAMFSLDATTIIAAGETSDSLDWTFDSDSEAFDYLAAGETLVLTYAVQVSDGTANDSREVTITITGTNDDPTITAADDSGAVTEDSGVMDGNLSDSGTITFDDVDLSDTHTVSVSGAAGNALGGGLVAAISDPATGAGDGTVIWTYTVANAAVQYLAQGEEALETFTVTIDDGNGGTVTQDITVTVTGTNDAPVIGNTDAITLYSVMEGSGEPEGNVGTLVSQLLAEADVSDVDNNAQEGLALTSTSGDGTWWYTLNGGDNWQEVGAVSESQALLLAANDNTLVYYEPGSGENGSLEFRAWDQTNGVAGQKVSALETGGSTAFSNELVVVEAGVEASPTQTLYLRIDQPTFSGVNSAQTFENFMVKLGGHEYEFSAVGGAGGSYNEATGEITLSGNSGRWIVLEIEDVPVSGNMDLEFTYSIAHHQQNSNGRGPIFSLGTSNNHLVGYDDNSYKVIENYSSDSNYTSGSGVSRTIGFGYDASSGHVTVTGVEDPIIFDLGDPGISLTGSAMFDMNDDGRAQQLAWTNGQDGILVMDLDGSGVIESGREVFSPDFGEGGHRDAMAALATLDSNGDGVIDENDEAFESLKLWVDANGDGVSDEGELFSLGELGIVAINLDGEIGGDPIDGQTVLARGEFVYADGSKGDYAAVELVETSTTMVRVAEQDGGTAVGDEGNDILISSGVGTTLIGGGGNDHFYGGMGDDVLIGGSGNDVMTGGGGANTMTGGGGNDIFIFRPVDGGGVDTITDFTVGLGEDADTLVLSDLLDGYDPENSLLEAFVQVREEEGNTVISVDRDGDGDEYGAIDLVILQGVTGVDLSTLLENQNLEV
ncbi:VCBS domain-containing protein, partial [Halomonas sp. M5N1S17]|uniref:VCBS domain-containing protein n=1 Tax=Halomonas alkalisoli TaxID=2907158 RepID=UPI001F3A1EDB